MPTKTRYEIPRSPPAVSRTFHELCGCVSADLLRLLHNQISLAEEKLSAAGGENREQKIRNGFALIERSRFLLDRYETFSENERALIVGAIRYFTLAKDGVLDATPIHGFTDDVAIMNFVLQELGVENKFIDSDRN